MVSKMRSFVSMIFIISILVILYIVTGPTKKDIILIIKYDTKIDLIARQLKYDQAIRSEYLFKLLFNLFKLHPISGEYRFHRRCSLLRILYNFSRNKIYYTSIYIPAGSNSWNIQKRLKDFVPEEIFWNMWNNPYFINQIGIIGAKNFEGLVVPLTYRFNHAQYPEDFFLQFINCFKKRIVPNLYGGVLPAYKTLIMASIIEKETNIKQEMYMVSGVYFRRLRMLIRLQCDPTVLYARWYGNGFGSNAIDFKDINYKSIFNTYVFFGLPPSPIAVPSINSINAARMPDFNLNLYFNLNIFGKHNFSTTLIEHHDSVKMYRYNKFMVGDL